MTTMPMKMIMMLMIMMMLIDSYSLCVFQVMMSWVSFWIDAQAVPARTTIGLLTVLTVVTQTTYLLQTLPSVSYIKAVDVWMVACLLFVFAAFLEYAAVNVLNQVQTSDRSSISQNVSQPQSTRGTNYLAIVSR